MGTRNDAFDGTDSHGEDDALHGTDAPDGTGVLERLETGERNRGLGPVSRRALGFLVTVAAIAVGFAYDYAVVPPAETLFPGWDVAGIDWLFAYAMAVVAWYLLYPLATTPGLARHYWRQLRGNRRAVASLAYLVCFYAVGICGPFALDRLRKHTGITGSRLPRGAPALQPPWGIAAPLATTGNVCSGRITDGMCHGTITHPLGTNELTQDMLVVTVEGAQSAMEVATVVAVVAAPIGVLVGTLAAHLGGRVDELAMRYVDLQLVIPPFFVYLFLQVIVGRSFVLLVAVFGLLNWGSVARLVRSEALGKRDLGYVRAAEDAGSGPLRTIRKHVVPNVSNTVVTAVTLMMPTVILVEVTLAFLQLSSPTATSWGNLISGASMLGPGTVVVDGFDLDTWWTELVPVVALLLTVVAFNVLGDALRDALDPRTEVRR